ncbi:vacuolar protein sorting-associated protein 18 homolog [Oppia nitens]|uniref:vacuolar protein sorting-associated protein 18 homolog n=1 Tax=Oppia nitens TaxID=1686743 RepID=UPI0023DBAD2C|nr:vacuolar protein sorting-associated protein 18 homolog [Oppia nitens]
MDFSNLSHNCSHNMNADKCDFCQTNQTLRQLIIDPKSLSTSSYEKIASLYTISDKSFEEMALKFIQSNEDEALKQFLVCELDSLSPKETTQMTVLLLWLIDIQLSQMAALKNSGKENTEEYELIEAEFRSLLSQTKVQTCLNKNRKAIYDLIESHAMDENLIYFSVLMKDYERVIEHHLRHKDYKQALNVLRQQGVPDLFYKFAPIIIQEMPSDLISVLIQFAPQLESTKLIPALVQQNISKDSKQHVIQYLETIRYLEHCAYKLGDSDSVIHNYLLALYAQTSPEKLMTYLSMKGQDESSVPYDIRYAIRVCIELGLDRACIHLYSTMGMLEEAVDLGLKIDIELAKQTADQPDIPDQMRKKLWLKIAKHVISGEQKDIKTATQVLKECELLKIEDILQFFSDFDTIDHFKEAICSSLQEYNRNIDSLKEDMKSATESAQQIRNDIKMLRQKFTVIRTEDKCCVCSYAILTRSFYTFPCNHFFHSDCLISELMPFMKPIQRSRVDEIQRGLGSSGNHSAVPLKLNDFLGDQSNNINVTNERERLLNELDDIVANECLYCGDIIISSIDQPFILPEEMNHALEDWD